MPHLLLIIRAGIKNFVKKPNPFKSFWHDYQWPVVAGLALLALGLGFIGFKKYFIAMGDQHTALDMFFYSLQLFVLEFNFTSGTVPLEYDTRYSVIFSKSRVSGV